MPSSAALAAVPAVSGSAPTGSDPPGSRAIDLATSASAMVQNLLPSANATLKLPKGVYVGEGIPPVPAKLAAKIRNGEYVDMGELLPEFWSGSKDEEGKEGKARRGRKVTEVFTWLQCFGSYVAVRGTHAPDLVPELMAYMATIVRVSQDYAGLAWVRYDAAFRRQAALTGCTRWSMINTTLYTTCFTGLASSTKRCKLCFATSHTEKECAQGGDPDPGMKDRLKAIESAVLALTGAKGDRQERPTTSLIRATAETCRKWNSSGCTYPRCKYTHACSVCKGSHPATRCSARTVSGARSGTLGTQAQRP